MHNTNTQQHELLTSCKKPQHIYNKYMKSCQENIDPKYANILNIHA